MIKRNRFGHITFDVAGRNLTGREELAGLESSRFPVGDHARQILLSEGEGSYDDVHRLALESVYKIVLLPGTYILRDANRTSNNIHKIAVKTFGYCSPLAGFVPQMCEPAFCQYMVSIGIHDIVPLHDPIFAADPNRYRLKIQCFEQILSSCPGHSEFLWDCGMFFAFFSHPES